MPTVEKEQAQIIRELLARIKTQAKTIQQHQGAEEEYDREVANLNRNVTYLEARLQLEKAGYRCTCGDES